MYTKRTATLLHTKSAEVEVSEAMYGNMIDSEGYLCYNVNENAAEADNPYIGPVSSTYKDNFAE